MKQEPTIVPMRKYFQSGATRDLQCRISALKKFRDMLNTYQDEIVHAISTDLHKPEFETLTTEIYSVKNEISYALSHIDCWSHPQSIRLSPLFFPSRASVSYAPYGVVLIIAPWNYPIHLSLLPLVGAIAAGNCVVIKPSEYAPATAQLLQRMISSTFDDTHVKVINADAQGTQLLLEQEKFDYIFFTGSSATGASLMQLAGKTLTPLTLELGGKNACIVTGTADIPSAARIIAWSKFLNAGQTCIAPDYILVDAHCKNNLIEELKRQIQSMFGQNPEQSPDYGRIITEAHTQRLAALLENESLIYGGSYNTEKCYFEPTLIDSNNLTTPLMHKEIFGPLLPIVSFNNLSDALKIIHMHPTPLSIGLFSDNREDLQQLKCNTQSGAITYNELMLHAGSERLPFGGVHQSGMGRYHGFESFKTFSYQRTILQGSSWIFNQFRYPPYTPLKTRLFKFFMKYMV